MTEPYPDPDELTYDEPGTDADESDAPVLVQQRMTWNTSASDFTGSQAVAVKIKSSAATATQTATVLGFRIRKV